MTLRLHLLGVLVVSGSTLVTVNAQAQTIKADHTTVDVSAIPAAGVAAARALRMSFSHASVGGNIWSGLATLAVDSTYAFPNWKDNDRGNPGWEAKITQFETWVAANASQFDVFQNKFCYIDPAVDFATYRDSMNKLATTYPSKIFVWWTIPITTDDADNAKRQSFNRQVRDYCKSNDKPLFDIADIESHKADGTAVTGSGSEALDAAQSSDGGHLNGLGAARAAMAQWALMAKVAGAAVTSPSTGSGGAATTGTSTTLASVGGTSTTTTDAGSNAKASDDSGCTMARANGSRGVATGLALIVAGMFMRRRVRVWGRDSMLR